MILSDRTIILIVKIILEFFFCFPLNYIWNVENFYWHQKMFLVTFALVIFENYLYGGKNFSLFLHLFILIKNSWNLLYKISLKKKVYNIVSCKNYDKFFFFIFLFFHLIKNERFYILMLNKKDYFKNINFFVKSLIFLTI